MHTDDPDGDQPRLARATVGEKRARFRELIAAPRILASPGVYDGYSAKLVAQAGFAAASTSGAGISNARLGQPDIGLLSLSDNLDTCRQLARSIDIPLTADAETGYGNAVSVHHVIEYFEETGVAGVNLEDQVSPKRCGHMKGKQVILEALGVARVSFARMLPAAAINAMGQALAVLREVIETGVVAERPDLLVGIEDIMALMGYPDIDELERRYMLEDERERRYGGGDGTASSAKQ